MSEFGIKTSVAGGALLLGLSTACSGGGEGDSFSQPPSPGKISHEGSRPGTESCHWHQGDAMREGEAAHVVRGVARLANSQLIRRPVVALNGEGEVTEVSYVADPEKDIQPDGTLKLTSVGSRGVHFYVKLGEEKNVNAREQDGCNDVSKYSKSPFYQAITDEKAMRLNGELVPNFEPLLEKKNVSPKKAERGRFATKIDGISDIPGAFEEVSLAGTP